jgi:hypothetical protein
MGSPTRTQIARKAAHRLPSARTIGKSKNQAGTGRELPCAPNGTRAQHATRDSKKAAISDHLAEYSESRRTLYATNDMIAVAMNRNGIESMSKAPSSMVLRPNGTR